MSIYDYTHETHTHISEYLQICFKPEYKLSSYRFRDDGFNVKEPRMYTFAIPGGDLVAPPSLQLYCHFEIHLESAESENHRVLELEEFINSMLGSTGWIAKVYFYKWLQDSAGSYKIALFGTRAPITKEKAEEVRLRIQGQLRANDFPLIERGAWTISKPCPVSMLPGYLEFIGADASPLGQ